jgi:hypothetical protein
MGRLDAATKSAHLPSEAKRSTRHSPNLAKKLVGPGKSSAITGHTFRYSISGDAVEWVWGWRLDATR